MVAKTQTIGWRHPAVGQAFVFGMVVGVGLAFTALLVTMRFYLLSCGHG
jgi:hypothetical protein